MSRLRHHGALLRVLVLVLLCAVGVGADTGTPPIGPTAGDAPAMEFAPTNPAEPTGAARAIGSLGEPGEDCEDRFTSAAEGEGAVDQGEVSEPSEEIGESPIAMGAGRIAAAGASRTPRRPDPLVELCCVRVMPTRAPPAIARTVR